MVNGLVPESLQATVPDARHQVAFLRTRHENRLATKQAFEDVLTDILALLHVVEQGARHPLHPCVVLHEQPLYGLAFHHVFTYNTPQRQKKLTPEAKIFTKIRFFGQSDRLPYPISAG